MLKKPVQHLVFALGILTSANLSFASSPSTLKEIWKIDASIEAPESAYFDPTSKLIFVSNVSGAPDAKDGKGWITKLSADGKVMADHWVDGLNAPKGLRAHQGILWVTNIDELIGITIADGKITQRIQIEGAKFLNDVVVSDKGTIYVSETVASAIYEVKDGKASVLTSGPELEHPNGLLWQDGKLVVAAWGTELAADWSTKKDGRLYWLDTQTKKLKMITAKPLGHLDGLESDGRGGFYVSDWMAGKVFHVTSKGKSKELLSGIKNAADIGWNPSSKTLLVPAMGGNQVTGFRF